jgi:S-methylmethionine-dependent homocysteine/selenocysteine methylase
MEWKMGDREDAPQHRGERPFLTDGGLETDLIFNRGIDLPCFAAFDLLKDDGGRQTLRGYFEPFLELAAEHRTGFVLDTATWRASPDWGERLGYSPNGLRQANQAAVALAEEIRSSAPPGAGPIVLEGVVGPRGDGYQPGALMSADEAERYHSEQIAALAGTDLITGITINYVEEAVGIVRAAGVAGIPAAVSFTVEPDGRLPTGQGLGDAIDQVERETDGAPAYYMVNCAHPTHFTDALESGGPWLERIGGVRANASRKSHAELDEAEELDDGDPAELGAQYRELSELLPNLTVLGGCCGTDRRHITAIAAACLS